MKKNTLELVVGLFMVAGLLAFGYLALKLGEVSLWGDSRRYTLTAEFDNVSGVKKGASVQISGVVVGEVIGVDLSEDHLALVTLRIDKRLQVPADSIASVKSQGIVGDKYIQLSLGGDDEILSEGGLLTETESAIDIESLISKFAFGSAK
ncbi:outer membrane lipid asymmetry maintenance protein MlaD [Desulfoprunum benzoelyticum]|uniref:Phospholipid/cholesterol/gamma-HCH transport system substrate-binding protein n=1 Tax=Desulfoprunum benzoelyticum TaxID=1506996 RepID=A0A840V4T0_9BACT|nr:outer membrane lipid asymmetry maintenance protein MlaD [Desulfoprunum benzoelyticum]MBB5348900.1 phospholipid/cholesterol/gamma-HCH transport system substrate-binding protein [Desulfoprunum benzoelyticum]MBM9530136.1 outer membrane lipid asymmetry maintenance protein MlaD [Desulfoprunum benzoelyticum]